MSNEGNQRYIPTRLEWVTVTLNVMYGTSPPLLDNPGFIVSFNHLVKENTIVIDFITKTDIDKDYLNEHVEAIKAVTQEHITKLGWDSWLRVEVQIRHP